MALRELVLTESESITRAGITTTFNIGRIEDINLDYNNKIIREKYTVGLITDGTYSSVREGIFTITDSSAFAVIVYNRTDSQIQDGIFDEMITAGEVGNGTKRDATAV